MKCRTFLWCLLLCLPSVGVAAGMDALLSGHKLSCEARSGGKRWPCEFRVKAYEVGGGLTGELSWTSLDSVHRVFGHLDGDRLTFTEVEALRRGRARLNVSYALTVNDDVAQGTYADPADGSKGTMIIRLTGGTPMSGAPEPSTGPTAPAKPEAPATPEKPATPALSGLEALLSGHKLSCEARSGGKRWPCEFRVKAYEVGGGLTGELSWTSLDSVHRVFGHLDGDRLTFTEVEALRRGRARLNVSYALTVNDDVAQGTYADPADGSKGTMTIRLR